MRIHTDHLTVSDIYKAARFARVDVVELTEHGSRKRDHAFNVKLEGESRRRPNGGQSGAGSGYAATWDQWGVFLAILFDLDLGMFTPYDASRGAFHARTADRFLPGGIVGTGVSTNYNVVNVPQYDDLGQYTGVTVHRVAGSYWPADAHGDHTFRFAGVPRQQSCTKCSAVQAW